MPIKNDEQIYNGQEIIFKLQKYMNKRKRTNIPAADLCVILEKCKT